MLSRRALPLAACLMAVAGMAQGHEWYPMSCCSSSDCWELPDGEATAEPGGWRIKTTGELIPYERARQTPPEGGGKFHRCSHGGKLNGDTIGKTYPKACFWAPAQGG